MQVKKCHICKQDKEVSMFYKDKTRKDGYSSRCKDCDRIVCNNKNHKKYKKNYKDNRLKMFRLLKDNLKCSLCQESNNECLDFHHIDNNKHETLKRKGGLSSFVQRYPIKIIIEELNKCICICSNCHRKIHSGKIVLTEEQKKDFRINLPENLFDIKMDYPTPPESNTNYGQVYL